MKMNGRMAKKIRREVRAARRKIFREMVNGLCGLPLGARLSAAWKIVFRVKMKEN